MMLRSLCLIIFSAFALVSFGNTGDSIRIAGRVSGATDISVEALVVAVLHPSDSSVVAYGMTDCNGFYSITFTTDLNEVLLRLTGFNVKRKIREVKAISQTADFNAEEASTTLREIQIKAQKLWGNRDTLNYLVAAYSTEFDRTIGDVLKQLPGITIDGGVIKYQGMPINHFYVENMDLLQGRYDIAVNGLKAEDVATVQVLENHEHVKALKDQVPPESAAINLKLKDKAKGVWAKSFGVGLGYDNDVRWNCEANLMYFGQRRQHAIYYGNDNTGNGANRSYQHYGGSGLAATVLTDILYPGQPPVGTTLYNNDHAFHMSNLYKLNGTAQLNFSLTYNHEVKDRSSYMQTAYLLPGSDIRIIGEDISARKTGNDANIRLSYENDAEKNFVCNTLDLSGQWNNANGVLQTNVDEIRQHAGNRNLGLSNNTRWVHRTKGGHGFEITSINTVQSTPQSLAVSEGMEATQEVNVTRVSTANRFSLVSDLRHHRWSFVPTVALNVDNVGLESVLKSHMSDNGKMDYLCMKARIGASLIYVKNEFRMTFGLPLALSYTGVRHEACKARVHFSPSFRLLWKANDNWTLSCDGHYGMSQTPWNYLVTSYIMGNYRTISRYVANLSDNHSASFNAKLNFKDVMNGFFAYVQGNISRSWSNVIYGTTIDDNSHTVMQAEYMPHHGDTYSVNGNVSKGFDWKNTRIEANVNYTRTNSSILRQSVKSDFHGNAVSVNGNVSVNVVRAVRLGYDCHYAFSRSMAEDYSHTIRTFGQHASLDVSFIRNRLFMNLTARHTHNCGLQGKKDYAFMDMSITYRTKKKMDIALKATNLFNTHTFISRSDTQLTQYMEVYYLRPRNIMLSTRFSL